MDQQPTGGCEFGLDRALASHVIALDGKPVRRGQVVPVNLGLEPASPEKIERDLQLPRLAIRRGPDPPVLSVPPGDDDVIPNSPGQDLRVVPGRRYPGERKGDKSNKKARSSASN
jgi:hypothetical protein